LWAWHFDIVDIVGLA